MLVQKGKVDDVLPAGLGGESAQVSFYTLAIGLGSVEVEVQVAHEDKVGGVGRLVIPYSAKNPLHQRIQLLAAVGHEPAEVDVGVDGQKLVGSGARMAGYAEADAEGSADKAEKGRQLDIELRLPGFVGSPAVGEGR